MRAADEPRREMALIRLGSGQLVPETGAQSGTTSAGVGNAELDEGRLLTLLNWSPPTPFTWGHQIARQGAEQCLDFCLVLHVYWV